MYGIRQIILKCYCRLYDTFNKRNYFYNVTEWRCDDRMCIASECRRQATKRVDDEATLTMMIFVGTRKEWLVYLELKLPLQVHKCNMINYSSLTDDCLIQRMYHHNRVATFLTVFELLIFLRCNLPVNKTVRTSVTVINFF